MGGYKNSITDIDGKVGIGVPDPAVGFEVNGFVRFNGGIQLEGTNRQLFAINNTDLLLGTNNTERMRINSIGQIGIGTNIPNNLTHIKTSTNTKGLTIQINSVTEGDFAQLSFLPSTADAGTPPVYIRGVRGSSFADSYLTLNTDSTERMRITSGGNVLIGTTSNVVGGIGGHSLVIDASSQNLGIKTASGNQQAVRFANDATAVGSINLTTTSTSYATSSDYRLKENVVEMTGALDRVDALKPSRFNFIADPNKTVDGFIAHEVAEVVPEAISGEKDAMEEYEVTPAEYETVIIQEAVEATYDEEGNELTPAQEAITEQRLVSEAVMGTRPVYQGIDQSKLVPLLVGAIQELRAEIEALKQNSVS